MMRLIVTGMLLVLVSVGSVSAAEPDAQLLTEIELARDLQETRRKVVVAQNMNLGGGQVEDFWKVYYNYRDDMREVNDRFSKLVVEYVGYHRGEELSDKKAVDMVNEFLSIEQARGKVKKTYVKKFKKVLAPKQVMRFYQVDNKLEVLTKLAVSRDIPLVLAD